MAFGWIKNLRPGRRRSEPQRHSEAYARAMAIGGTLVHRDRPLVKPTPSNLRQFARTVYARRAINAIKNPIAMLDWEVVAKPGIKETRELLRQIETVTACLAAPNHDDSWRTLLEQAVEDILCCGAAAIEQQLGGDQQRPLWLWPVDATSIQIYAGWDGSAATPRYVQTQGYGNVGGVGGIPLRNDELIYIRHDPTTATPFGYGPLEIAYSAINHKLGVSEYAGDVSSNADPAYMLQFTRADESTLATMRGYWRNEVEGRGQTPIVGYEEIKKIELRKNGDESLFLEYQDLLIREIATAFGISPQKLGSERDVNRNTAEVAQDADWDLTIKPLAEQIASYLTREAIAGKLGFSQIEFRFVGLDREDEDATAKIFETYYRNNAITPDEQRERLGLPPMEGQWGKLTFADTQIALQAARGVGAVEDPALPAAKAAKQKDKT